MHALTDAPTLKWSVLLGIEILWWGVSESEIGT
jgi:hypothetical protein